MTRKEKWDEIMSTDDKSIYETDEGLKIIQDIKDSDAESTAE